MQRFAIASILIAALSFGTATAEEGAIALRSVAVVHPDSAEISHGQTVIVEGDVISRVGPAASVAVPEGARNVDGAGKFLVPGLTEMHAHIPGTDRGEQYVRDVLFLFVANGVTTIRGMLGQPYHLSLKERVANGEITGPRIYTSGPSLNGNTVSSPLDAAAKVRMQKAAGYDFIKQHPGLSAAEFHALAKAADAVNMPFAGHISRDAGLHATLAAGQATIDHLEGYLAAAVPEDKRGDADPGFFGLGLADRVEAQRLQALAEATAASGTAVVPTETLMRNMAGAKPASVLAERPEMRYVPKDMLAAWRRAKEGFVERTGADPVQRKRFLALRADLIGELHEAGATILLGSDAPQVFNVPGFSIHHELGAYVSAGLTPAQALASGTTAPARFFGAENWFGQIREGLSAEFLLLDANPLENVAHLRKLEGVMLRGRWLDREALDQGLEAIAARYAEGAGNN